MITKIKLNWYEIYTKSDMIVWDRLIKGNEISRSSFKKPYWTWIGISSNQFWANALNVKFILEWTTSYDLEDKINTIISKVYTDEEIDIEVYYKTDALTELKLVWKWYLNTQEIFKRDPWMINIVKFDFEILINKGYLEKETQETWWLYTINYTWQFKTPFKYTWTVWIWWGWSVWDDRYLQIWYNGKYIRVYWPFTDWDVIVIDWILKEVRKNNDLINYNWIFPELIPWSNSLYAWSWFTNWASTLPLPAINLVYTNKYVKL